MKAAHFCNVTGARIAKPGVSKSVDPVDGQDEVFELPDGSIQPLGLAKQERAAHAVKPAKQAK